MPDGSQRVLPVGGTGLDLALSIAEGLARAAVAVEVDGEIRDLRLPLPDGATVRILTDRDEESLAVLRHSAAHVMAEAVTRLWPGTKVTIGPSIDNGFYYDFDFPDGVSVRDDDLPAIENEMRRIVKEGRSFSRSEISRNDALKRFADLGEQYKVELIEDLPADVGITLYRQSARDDESPDGAFTDLCRGPHVQSLKPMKAIKLLHVAGAYWRGDASRPMLTRIYGTAFFSKARLEEHLENLERARKNDHRRLGTSLDLYSFHDVSPGGPFWHPRGLVMWNAITDMWRSEHRSRGYQEVKTPLLYNPELWKRSGHWEHYRDNMYITQPKPGDDRQFGLKPMNCPAHATILKTRRLSWRDLPVRMNEQGLVHRYEPGGVLHGLMRVRHITQDDAHIFCSPDQVEEEVVGVLDFVLDLYRMFGFDDWSMELSTRPAKSMGSDEMWAKAEAALAAALDRHGIEYQLNPGDGAFYGPKIDFHIHDSMGRTWQCGTVQLDFSLPERFELVYSGEDNAEHQLVVIHRALLGSMERFVGILIEHYEGEFPLWLAPVQATVVPVSSEHHCEYEHTVCQRLTALGLRVDVDDRAESMGRRIRDAEKLHTPLILVVGESERDGGAVSVRRRGSEGQQVMVLDELAGALFDEIRERRVHPQLAERLQRSGTSDSSESS